ncbi:transglycosylase SLT domain-containing protein [Nocardia brasiliensis]|uniref:transglycosylase SLT domain-containing protein n=1 Tax=Nocardia brasiliensis TaxID=37326 RepID=UPI0024561039|nr:transglycosylase SLT domain-containing protein [Nocardia brasiliensis]
MNAIAATKHYRVVQLHPPDAASPGLRGLIETAEQGMQTSVDLLGDGRPDRAPDVMRLLRESGLVDERGQAEVVDEHSDAVHKLGDIKARLRELDKGVGASTAAAGSIPEGAWAKIKVSIDTLDGLFAAAPPPAKGETYLSRGVEIKLQGAVHATLSEVDGHVRDAERLMQQQAANISGQGFPVTPHGSGNAGPASTGSAPMGPGPMSAAPPRSSPFRPAGTSRAKSARSGYDARYTDQLGTTTADPNGRRKLSKQELEVHIGKALDALGITDPAARANWTRGYLVLIARESGGDAGAINLDPADVNAAAGRPSQGLTQTIPSTFRSYHVAGTSSAITDPTANIAASMNYVMQRYHVSRDGSNLAANVQQADPTRSPRGY